MSASMTTISFLQAVVFSLWRSGNLTAVDSNDACIHQALASALDQLDSKELEQLGVEVYVDPITQRVGDVYRLLAHLQAYGLARRSNPIYTTRAELLLTDDTVSQHLANYSEAERGLIDQFAEAVKATLEANGPVMA
jgi:hypothetical protein